MGRMKTTEHWSGRAQLAGVCLLAIALAGPATLLAKGPGGGGDQKPPPEEAGNNLSFPVIWTEGVTKTLPGTPGMTPVLEGEWWYQWGTNGTDPNISPASCPPDPDEEEAFLNPDGLPLCDDGVPDSVDLGLEAGTPPADNPLPLAKAYLQKDQNNAWQALSGTQIDMGVAESEGEHEGGLFVDWIDWGDNLESVDWYTRSQVRTEVVLFKDNPDPVTTPWLEYQMRHTDGWGINEVHGLAANLEDTALTGPGDRATVYSHCARLTIQKLLVDRESEMLSDLVWVPGEGWTEPEGYPDDLINPHIFNGSVHEGGDGPGYYSAEINVKGRIIYGYTWNVRQLNEGPGDYRITFSFDQTCGTSSLNTYFVNGTTQILLPLEETVPTGDTLLHDGWQSHFGPTPLTPLAAQAVEEEPAAGATPVLQGIDPVTGEGKNLTYIDIRIHERSGGGGGGQNSGKVK